MALAILLVLAGVALVVLALAVRDHRHSVATRPPRTLPADARGRRVLAGVQQTRAEVTLAGGQQLEWCLLLARTRGQQDRGLMGVTDPALGGFDGMLFSFGHPTDTLFWMRDTLLPLSIAFFGADGRYVSSTDMAPCGNSSNCPDYGAEGTYTSAVEVPRGRIAALGIGPGSTLVRESGACNATASPSTTLRSTAPAPSS